MISFGSGCPNKATDICEGGESTCPTGSFPYGCLNAFNKEIAGCHENLTAAHAWCASKGGGSNGAYEIDCTFVGGDDEVGDSGWEPGEYVNNVSPGVYNVDYALVGQIKNDINILDDDSTYLVESAMADYFELSGVANGDLASVLGLQSGDILLSVNGHGLDGVEDALAAYSAVEDDGTLVLEFKRSGTVHYHTYHVIFTF